MSVRQVRGIAPGVLAQERSSVTVRHYIPDASPTGKTSLSGLVTIPYTPRNVRQLPGDPIVTRVPGSGDVPVGEETKDAARIGDRPAATSSVGIIPIAGVILAALNVLK